MLPCLDGAGEVSHIPPLSMAWLGRSFLLSEGGGMRKGRAKKTIFAWNARAFSPKLKGNPILSDGLGSLSTKGARGAMGGGC